MQKNETPPPPATDFLEQFINERDMFEQDTTGTLEPPLPRGLVIDGPALLEALQTPESQCALLRAAQVASTIESVLLTAQYRGSCLPNNDVQC